MSASNWTVCPRCACRSDADLRAETARVNALYGTVPVGEFEAAQQALTAKAAAPLAETWREDYEFYGADEGTLRIRYSASCAVCDLTHRFSADQPIQGWKS